MKVSELGKGMTIEYNGELFVIEEYSHMKKAQRRPVAQTKLRNLSTGKVFNQNFVDGDPVKIVRLEERPLQYLYSAGDEYHFIDNASYDQFALTKAQLGDAAHYLKENLELRGLFYEGKMVRVELPITVELKVVETMPGVRGDTATGGEKPAKLETGLQVKVPLFVKEGDILRVDTRTGEYVKIVSKSE